jgi:hypothetical protein
LTKKNPKRVSINQNDIFKESSEEELDKLENIKFWRKARDRKKKKQSFVYEELFKIERIICGRIRRKKVNV